MSDTPVTASELIERLALEPLPVEGGYYRRTHASPIRLSADCLGPGYDGPRPVSTAILYLLTADTMSALHRLPGEEVFHFYLGDPVRMLTLHADGVGRSTLLGNNLLAGMELQHVVEAGCWQGSRLEDGGQWALLGVTMTPGYDGADFEAGDRDRLTAAYPDWAGEIRRLSPDGDG